MITRISRPVFGAAVLLLLTPALVWAHPHHGVGGGFAQGFLHPLHGLDHILAMLAVGLLAFVRGGRATLALPGAFVVMAAVGWVLGFSGLAVPHVEPVILASVVGLGILIAAGRQVSPWLAVPLLAAFGAAHGMAHGIEIPGAALTAGLGLVGATVLLHATGIGLGAGLTALGRGPVIRYAGGLVAAVGGVLFFL